ncbi:MAG: hypothetical protein U9O96_07870 [Candidatus Thermoplasmatota archaeon]|nr:hypothetical protein [Candidatus Thermoplasmatota archaeon]
MIGRKALSIIILFALVLPIGMTTNFLGIGEKGKSDAPYSENAAFNPPDNVTIVVDIIRVRAMTMKDCNPGLYFKILIDGENSVWWEQVYEGNDIWFEWPTAARTISYDINKTISIQIEVWEKKAGQDIPCDISKGKSSYLAGKTINLFYDIKRGEWTGDDYLGDKNGYGHCSGFEDGNENENDCEIWFDIYQWGYDGWWGSEDRLTYWEKANVYGLNASRNYAGVDFNGDGLPIEWEDKYGFDPFAENNASEQDPDKDGLTNLEEYKTSQWLSDPFAQDIFIEVDGMQAKHPWQKPYTLPKESQQLLCNAFAGHNITIHIDDGSIGGGGDLIPYDDGMTGRELMAARYKYFLNEDENNWKRGVFHYAIICNQMEWYSRPAGGRMFYIDSHCVGGQYIRNWAWSFYLQRSNYYKALASVFMHELGHTLGLMAFEGIDNEKSRFPWNKEYWEWGPYESCMNYRYVYKLVDYSNGDDPDHDQDDWHTIDLTRFTEEGW